MDEGYTIKKCVSFSEAFEIKMFKILMQLHKECGATYMSYTFDTFNSVRFNFRSDANWNSIYQNTHISGKPLMELCPLDKASRANRNGFILWDLYCHESQPKVQREIMGMRKDRGMHHGLTLSTYFENHNDAIAVASEDINNDLGMNMLVKEQGKLLKESLLECRKEALLYFSNMDLM